MVNFFSFFRSSNLGKQGIWAFEIGNSDNVLSAKIALSPTSIEYGDYDQFPEVTTDASISHQNPIEISEQEVSYDISRRGDQLHTSYGLPQPEDDLQTPYQVFTEQPPAEPQLQTGKTPPLAFPDQPFHRQQIINVEEDDETGIGKVNLETIEQVILI